MIDPSIQDLKSRAELSIALGTAGKPLIVNPREVLDLILRYVDNVEELRELRISTRLAEDDASEYRLELVELRRGIAGIVERFKDGIHP